MRLVKKGHPSFIHSFLLKIYFWSFEHIQTFSWLDFICHQCRFVRPNRLEIIQHYQNHVTALWSLVVFSGQHRLDIPNCVWIGYPWSPSVLVSHYPGSLCLPTFQIFKYPRSSSILAFQVSQYPPNLLILPPFKSLQSAVCGLLGIIPRPSILTTHPYYNADFNILVEIEYARPVPKIIVSTIKIYEWAYKGICLYFWDNQRESNKHICSQND